MSADVNLYESLVSITEEYLGPAGRRFIDRQIRNHLKKEPGKLSKNDFERLFEWTRLAFALLTHDQHVLREYSERLNELKAGKVA